MDVQYAPAPLTSVSASPARVESPAIARAGSKNVVRLSPTLAITPKCAVALPVFVRVDVRAELQRVDAQIQSLEARADGVDLIHVHAHP